MSEFINSTNNPDYKKVGNYILSRLENGKLRADLLIEESFRALKMPKDLIIAIMWVLIDDDREVDYDSDDNCCRLHEKPK